VEHKSAKFRPFSSFPDLEMSREKFVDGFVSAWENMNVDVDCAGPRCNGGPAAPWHCGHSPVAKPVEELTPDRACFARDGASAGLTGLLLRGGRR